MEVIIIIVLLAVAAETTYLTAKTIRKERRETLAPVFVDTSVLIDGRIIAVAESGFLTRPLYIPRSVVGELQFLADNADPEKRSRARHGLDIINQLQSITSVKTVIFADGVKAEEGVDNRLLTLAKKHGGSLCTIDYNLNKVALVEGLEVLNVNELAKSLRMAYLPGERARIELTQKGNDQHQAVGHLEDGTMVVVEHAYKQIGSTVEVEFIRSLQTAAGKMKFAKLAQSASQPNQQPKKLQKPTGRQTQQRKEKEALIPEQTAPAPSQQPQKPAGQPRQSQSRPQRTQQPQQQSQTRQQSNRRTRKSPEDSLVELANK
jgi:uncharacterized protein YacL